MDFSSKKKSSSNQSTGVTIGNIFTPFLNVKVFQNKQNRVNPGCKLFSSSVYYSIFNYLVKEVAENMASCQMFITTSQSIPTAQKLTISTTSTMQDKVFFICSLFSRGQLPNMAALHLIIMILLKKQGLRGESA